MPETVPPEAERLYGLPLEEFTDERNAVARELRREGRGEDADVVRKLRRPSAPLWAVNQLARGRPDEVRRLLEEAGRLRRGEGEATDTISSAIDALVRSARTLVEEAGRPASDATLQRIARTLRAAVADEGHSADLAAGRLQEELEPAGFEAMAALADIPPGGRAARPPQRPSAAEGRRERQRVRAAREAVAKARDRARELRRAAEAAERDARRAVAEADRAEAELARAEERLAAARDR